MSETVKQAEARGYSRGYQAKRREGVDHKDCLEKQANTEMALIEAHAEITSLNGQIAGMHNALTLMKDRYGSVTKP